MRGEQNKLEGIVQPVIGSVVYCDLLEIAEHTGIYVGNDEIVHLDGSGDIEKVTSQQFLKRLNGLNLAAHIYVSCDGDSAVGDTAIAKRALKMVTKKRKYNVLFDNCHQFTSGCITGDFENSDNFLWMVKDTVTDEMGADDWLVWSEEEPSELTKVIISASKWWA